MEVFKSEPGRAEQDLRDYWVQPTHFSDKENPSKCWYIWGGRGVSSLLNKGESLCNTYSSLCSSHMFSQRPGCIMGPTRACLDRAPDLLKSTSKAMQVCCEIWHWQGVSPSTVPSRTGSGIQVYAWQAHGDFGLTTWPGQCEERKALLAPDGHPQPRPFSPNPTVQ